MSHVFPVAASGGGIGGAGAGRALPPALRLLRSNAEAFSDSPSAGLSPTDGSGSRSGRLQIPSRDAEAFEVSPSTGGSRGGGSGAGGGSDVGGPARAARERARRSSAVQASLVKVRTRCCPSLTSCTVFNSSYVYVLHTQLRLYP